VTEVIGMAERMWQRGFAPLGLFESEDVLSREALTRSENLGQIVGGLFEFQHAPSHLVGTYRKQHKR